MGTIPDVSGVEMPGLIKPGFYFLTVDSAEIRESQAQNNMLAVKMSIDNRGGFVYDNFVFNNDFALSRLRQFAEACGLGGKLANLDPADFEDAQLGAWIFNQKNPRDGNEYPKAKTFIPRDAELQEDQEWVNDEEDDDCPFD